MNSDTLHLAPKRIRLAVARAIVDKAAGDPWGRATGEGAAAGVGISSHRKRADARVNGIRMRAGGEAAVMAGHAATAGARYVTMKWRTLAAVALRSSRPAIKLATRLASPTDRRPNVVIGIACAARNSSISFRMSASLASVVVITHS